MGIYNFQAQFVPWILDGSKTHTIRGVRMNPDVAGNTLHLYTGLRTKRARLLLRAPCTKVESIRIESGFAARLKAPLAIYIDEHLLDGDEAHALAWRDGFRRAALFDMAEFWKGRLPFVGHVYHWRRP